MMKKLLGVAALLAVLAGCSDGPTEPPPTTRPPGPEVVSDSWKIDAHTITVDGVAYVCITLDGNLWCDRKVDTPR